MLWTPQTSQVAFSWIKRETDCGALLCPDLSTNYVQFVFSNTTLVVVVVPKSSADHSARKSSPWHIVENPCISWLKVMEAQTHSRLLQACRRCFSNTCSLLLPYMAFCRNQQQPRSTETLWQDHRDLARSKSVEESHPHVVLGSKSVELTSPCVKKPITGSTWNT